MSMTLSILHALSLTLAGERAWITERDITRENVDIDQSVTQLLIAIGSGDNNQ